MYFFVFGLFRVFVTVFFCVFLSDFVFVFLRYLLNLDLLGITSSGNASKIWIQVNPSWLILLLHLRPLMIIIRVSIVIINIIIDLHTQCTSSAPMPWHPYHFSRHVPMCDAWHDTCDTWKYLAHIFYLLSLIFSLHVRDTLKWHTHENFGHPTSTNNSPRPNWQALLQITSFEDFWSQKCCQFFQQKYLLMKGTKRVTVLLNPPSNAKSFLNGNRGHLELVSLKGS